MCINAEVSLIAFIYCSTTSYYLYWRNNINDRWIALLFGYIGIMQLLEYIMWIDQKCVGINQLATSIGGWFVISQPLVSIVIAYYMNNRNIPIWIYGILILYKKQILCLFTTNQIKNITKA